MISIIKEPYACSFTKNPIGFKVQTNMQYPSKRVFPGITFEINATYPTAGIHFRWSFTNPETQELVKIYIATSNNVFIGSLPVWAFSGPRYAYAVAVAQRLKEIPELNAFYEIYTDDVFVHVVARQALRELIPMNLETNQPGTPKIKHTVQELVNDPEERQDYSMRAMVYFEREYLSGSFELVANMNCIPDESSIAQLEIGNVIDSEIEAGWNEVPMPAQAIETARNLRRYYVEFLESWTGNSAGEKTTTKTLFAHWGGVSTNDQLLGEPLAYLQSNNQFLTWMPSGKRLYKSQQDWLSWMNTGIQQDFSIYLVLYKNTGAQDVLLGTQTLQRWESITIPVGYQQLDLESMLAPGESFIKWAIVIRSGPNNVSPLMTYYTDVSSCVQNQIMYYNSFGVAETFSTTGVWEESMQVNSQMADRSMQFNNYRLRPGSFIFDSTHRNAIKTETPRILKQEAYRLQSMLNTLVAFAWQDNERWVPAIVMTEKKVVKIESEFTTELEVELLLANENDRASFYSLIPQLKPVYACGIVQFDLEENGLTIADYDQLQISSGGVFVQDANWDTDLKAYVCDPALTDEKTYDARVTVIDAAGSQHVVTITSSFTHERIFAYYTATGTVSLGLQSSLPAASISIDWGTGAAPDTVNYTSTLDDYSKSVAITGEKQLILKKPCFDDIITFGTGNMQLIGMDFKRLKNLQYLNLAGAGIAGKLYLNGLAEMKILVLNGMSISAIEIGIMPQLLLITLDDLSLSIDSVDALIAEIWQYRKHFLHLPEVTFTGCGPTAFSSKAQAMIDGAGIYTGEGLSADYGFSFSIS